MPARPSQLSPHHASRVELPGRYGVFAALRAEADEPGEGATVLLVPGFTGSKEDFAPILDPVAAAGLTAIAIDLPGQYESPGPEDEASYQPDALGEVVAELVTDLAARHRVILLGHSYGGLVARGAVLTGAPVSGLVLLDSGPAELPSGFRRMALDISEPTLRADGIAAAQRMREQLDSAAPGWDQVSGELKQFLYTRLMRSSVPGLLGMADGLRHEPDRVTKLAHALRAAPAPALVVCGEGDDAWPVAAQRDMADRLEADFAVISKAKHSPAVENPEALLATLVPTWHSWLGD